MLARDPAWTFSIAYNGVLQVSRALMFFHGFRPSSHESHKNTFAYLRVIIDEDRKALVEYFNRMRTKRHQAVYEAPVRVTRTEAETLIEHAEIFINWVKEEVTG